MIEAGMKKKIATAYCIYPMQNRPEAPDLLGSRGGGIYSHLTQPFKEKELEGGFDQTLKKMVCVLIIM